MVASLRLFGKKELAQLSIIDLVFILLISNSVQNAMVGSFEDFIGGLLSAGALFSVNFVLKLLLFKDKKIASWLEGEPISLIPKGHLQQSNLNKTQITLTELEAAVREHGVEKIGQVDLAVLEIDGNTSILSANFTHKTIRKRKAHRVISKQQG